MTSAEGSNPSLVNRLEEGLLATLLGFMTLITFIQVVLRYVFNTGLVWSLEATTYAFAALVLFGMSYCVRVKSHIAVDLFVSKLPVRMQHYVSLLVVVICVSYAGLMLYGSSVFVERLFALGNYARDVPLPKWLLTLSMPLGFLLLAFRFLEVGWTVLRNRNAQFDTGSMSGNTQRLQQHDSEQDR